MVELNLFNFSFVTKFSQDKKLMLLNPDISEPLLFLQDYLFLQLHLNFCPNKNNIYIIQFFKFIWKNIQIIY